MSPFLPLSGSGSSASIDTGVVIALGFLAFGVTLGGVFAWTAYLNRKEADVGGENETTEKELQEHLATESDDYDGAQQTRRRWTGLIAAGY